MVRKCVGRRVQVRDTDRRIRDDLNVCQGRNDTPSFSSCRRLRAKWTHHLYPLSHRCSSTRLVGPKTIPTPIQVSVFTTPCFYTGPVHKGPKSSSVSFTSFTRLSPPS